MLPMWVKLQRMKLMIAHNYYIQADMPLSRLIYIRTSMKPDFRMARESGILLL